jgi:hypothetical protein
VDFSIIERVLEVGAYVAEIVTGVTAAVVGGRYLWLVRRRRLILEKYLESEQRNDESLKAGEHGLRTVLHLMGYTAMTEADVLDAAFASRNIVSFASTDPKTGRADALFFQFERDTKKMTQRLPRGD